MVALSLNATEEAPMTMRLTIKNDDPARSAVITVIDQHPDVRDGAPSVASMTDLSPGQQTHVYIHAGRKLEISEKP